MIIIKSGLGFSLLSGFSVSMAGNSINNEDILGCKVRNWLMVVNWQTIVFPINSAQDCCE